MASSGVDVASLTPDQQSALDQYLAFTNQELDAAIPILQRAQWNVQIAISRFFDGEPATDPVAEALEAQAAAAAPPAERVRLDDTFFQSTPTRPPRFRAAPRIVPPPNPEVQYRPGFPFNIILGVFSLGTGVVSRIFRILTTLVPFLPALLARLQPTRRLGSSDRRALQPQDTAERFQREFEEEYGSHQLPFLSKGYAHALDQAKRELKYLLIVIISPEHDDTSSWVKNTLLSANVVAFLNNKENNVLLWAGSVQDSESYQIANAFHATKFPYAALIAQTSNSSRQQSQSSTPSGMSIIAPLPGPLLPTEFLSRIRRAMESHAPERGRQRAEVVERETSRTIREEQDTAYERSLAIDRERARLKREEAERQKREEEIAAKLEQERASVKQKAEDWRLWRAARVPSEPAADNKTAARVSIRLPNGERLVRRFPGDAVVEEIYAFVECSELLKADQISKEAAKPLGYDHVYKFQLVSPMPRTVYDLAESRSIKDSIGRSANLIVERLEDDEDEE